MYPDLTFFYVVYLDGCGLTWLIKGRARVDVDERGKTWLTKGRC